MVTQFVGPPGTFRASLSDFVMLRVLAIVPAAFSVLVAGVLHAEEPAEAQLTTQSTSEVAMVEGLALDDLLNVRMKASPVEKVVGRLPNGATVRKYECKTVNGYEWCRVDAIDTEGVSGWTPARYLQNLDLGEDPTGTVAAREADAAVERAFAQTPEPAGPDDAATAAADKAAAAGEPAADVATQKDSALTVEETPDVKVAAEAETLPPATTPDVEVPLPVGIEARFAGAPSAAAKEPPAAREETVALAFAPAITPKPQDVPAAKAAAKGDKVSPEVVVSLPPRLEDRFAAPEPDLPKAEAARTALLTTEPLSPPAESGTVEIAEAKPDDVPVIVPTPRPDPAGDAKKDVPAAPVEAALAEQQTLAAVPAGPPAAMEAAAGEIPCARYVGQPMTRCEARVARIGDADADVTVAWPDGGTRIIRFRNGAPEGSNSRGEFRFTREGSLSMIRIGASERFEIIDELSFGG